MKRLCLFGFYAVTALAETKVEVSYRDRLACDRMAAMMMLTSIQECTQVVMVFIRTSDSTVRAFDVVLSYKDQRGVDRSQRSVVMADRGRAAVAFEDVTDIAINKVLVSPLTVTGESTVVP